MFEKQYDPNRKFEGPFTPHPEVMEHEDYIFYVPEKKFEKENITVNEIPTVEKKEPETKDEPKEEKGLTVTNNVNYEIKDRERTGLFRRR